MSDLADLFPDGTFAAGPEPDEPAEPVETEEEEPEESGADEPDGDAPAAAEVELIDGKFKTQDDLLAAYHEAQRALHESRQPKDEPEEEDQDPYGLWGTALGDGEAQQLAERLIQFPHEAQGIIEWVEENKDQFGVNGDQIADQMFQLWHAQNPRAANRWDSQAQWAEREARLAEQNAPIQSHYVQQMAGLAVHRATAELPRFAEFKDQIMESITSPNMQSFLAANPEYASDPQKMFEVLQGAWTNLIAQEYRTNQQHAASASGQPEPGTTEKAKPRTQQRSTAAAPATGGVEDLFPSGTFREG